MWWFSVFAVLKGWIDRGFANGVAYRYPDVPAWSGFLASKRGMLVMTSSYEPEQFRGDRMGHLDRVLHPLVHARSPKRGCGCSTRSSPTPPARSTTRRGRVIWPSSPPGCALR
jgi:putative NADPH-quinone reductase